MLRYSYDIYFIVVNRQGSGVEVYEDSKVALENNVIKCFNHEPADSYFSDKKGAIHLHVS